MIIHALLNLTKMALLLSIKHIKSWPKDIKKGACMHLKVEKLKLLLQSKKRLLKFGMSA